MLGSFVVDEKRGVWAGPYSRRNYRWCLQSSRRPYQPYGEKGGAWLGAGQASKVFRLLRFPMDYNEVTKYSQNLFVHINENSDHLDNGNK